MFHNDERNDRHNCIGENSTHVKTKKAILRREWLVILNSNILSIHTLPYLITETATATTRVIWTLVVIIVFAKEALFPDRQTSGIIFLILEVKNLN